MPIVNFRFRRIFVRLAATTIGAATLISPLHAAAATTVFLTTSGNVTGQSMICPGVAVNTGLGTQTVWICGGAVATNAVTGGSSAGAVAITATTSPGTPTCGSGTSASFTFDYADPFGLVTWTGNVPYNAAGGTCATAYTHPPAIRVTATSINPYLFLNELCGFQLSGPFAGATLGGTGFGVFTMTFNIDSNGGTTSAC